jgi:tRNA pseudouridine-54 N-methylase
MSYRRFLILFRRFPIDEVDVRAGENAPEVIVACRSINVGLFISGDLRRNVEVSIAYGEKEDLRVMTFPGQGLKRVSPDERSISFFLLKATKELADLHLGGAKHMDNGIELRRTGLAELLSSWCDSGTYVAQDDSAVEQVPVETPSGLYIYEVDDAGISVELAKLSVVTLQRPPSPERFILDINLSSDRLQKDFE